MAVIWNKFISSKECFEEIIKKVGFEFEEKGLFTSNSFLVVCKFSGFENNFDLHVATISKRINGNEIKTISYNLIVSGMSEQLEISHWSEINLPEE